MEIVTKSAPETKKLGQKLATYLTPKDVVCLYGDLGSGKTTFVQGLAKGLAVKQRVVSPTFIFIHEYRVNTRKIKKLYHVDLYRIEKDRQLAALGLELLLSQEDSVTVIEWAEKAKELLPNNRIDIHFQYRDDQRLIRCAQAPRRCYELTPSR